MSTEHTNAIPMQSVLDVSSIATPARFEKLIKIDALGQQRMAQGRALTQRCLR
jgi:hypothetical protein